MSIKDEKQEILMANFCDIYDIKPAHYDCVLGRIKLPWNNQVINIFINYGIKNHYRPVLNGLYAQETSNIYLYGESFSEQDVSIYFRDTMCIKGKTKKYTDDEKDVYLQGYSDAMKEHNLFIENVKKYMDKYDYIKAKKEG